MRTRSRHRGGSKRQSRGFTLIELLVVIFIILLISAVALPTILPAFNHRQVSEAGRILQGALVGARDKAIHDNQPCGIRLMPDPAFPIGRITSGVYTGQIYPYSILAYNRVIPIESPPEYSEGKCTPVTGATVGYLKNLGVILSIPVVITASNPFDLILIESLAKPSAGGYPNPPTSWFWNIRVGDQIQISGAGPWYTVVGPIVSGPSQGNSEMFVNTGPPAANSQYSNMLPSVGGNPAEYLVLVNGKDDNNNGWVDELHDGIDNNNINGPDDLGEYEQEAWLGSIVTNTEADVSYTIRRRPAPTTNAREIALPTDVVIDATTLFTSQERSRLPLGRTTAISGTIDIILNPDGTVLPITGFSTKASFQMGSAFYHFWLAERQDLTDVTTTGTTELVTYGPSTSSNLGSTAMTVAGGTASYYLPIAEPTANYASSFPGPYLKGEYSVLTLFTRTGQIVVNSNPPFVNQYGYYHAINPFIQAEQGVFGGP